MKEPQITVGILSGKEIEFFLPESFVTPDGTMASGIQKAVFQKGKIYWQGKAYNELSFSPIQDTDTFFELKDVTIGINFHWERKETQRFKGSLKIIVEEERLTAINVISIEEYLTSVISSEMSATASLSLLKAHAVISRSWLVHKLRTRNILNEELRMKDETLGLHEKKTQSVLPPLLLMLHSSNGTIMKHIHTLMFVPMIIVNVIRELPVLPPHKLSKPYLLPGERCLYTKEKSVTHVFPNVAAALLKSSKIAGKMSGIHT